MCVCARARACVRACVRACACVRVCVRARAHARSLSLAGLLCARTAQAPSWAIADHWRRRDVMIAVCVPSPRLSTFNIRTRTLVHTHSYAHWSPLFISQSLSDNSSVPRRAFQHATFNMQRSTCNVQHSRTHTRTHTGSPLLNIQVSMSQHPQKRGNSFF